MLCGEGLERVQPGVAHVRTDSRSEGARVSRQMQARAEWHVTGALFTGSARSREPKLAHGARAQNIAFSSKVKCSYNCEVLNLDRIEGLGTHSTEQFNMRALQLFFHISTSLWK